jgi:hypothetical protein
MEFGDIGKSAQLPALAADLVGRRVAVIAATGSGNAILAASRPITPSFGGKADIPPHDRHVRF